MSTEKQTHQTNEEENDQQRVNDINETIDILESNASERFIERFRAMALTRNVAEVSD